MVDLSASTIAVAFELAPDCWHYLVS